MSTSLAIQYAIVVLVVAVSALIAFHKLAPRLTNRWLAAVSLHLRLRGRSRLAKWLGRRLQPKQATGNCADGCAACGVCGSRRPALARPPNGAMPLRFRPRASRNLPFAGSVHGSTSSPRTESVF